MHYILSMNANTQTWRDIMNTAHAFKSKGKWTVEIYVGLELSVLPIARREGLTMKEARQFAVQYQAKPWNF